MNSHEVEFHLPFNGTWMTFWGGDTPEQNHHHANRLQKYAFDFIKDGSDSFGSDVLAPAHGVVFEVSDGMRDNDKGEMDTYNVFGNFIMIEHDETTYSVLCHLKQGSIVVKQGDKVGAGSLIAQCGNSGNTSESHVHVHVQDAPVLARVDENYDLTEVARGKKVYFAGIAVEGKRKDSYSPVKGDVIANAE